MNEKNFDYLKDQVKFSGFGELLEDDLKMKIEKGDPDFKLLHSHEFGKDKVEATLHFRKSDSTDMYFFNKYDLNLQKDNEKDLLIQTFYIGKDNNYTLKEGYNLMSGRAVNKDLKNKEGETYNAWVQMDFKQSEDNGNFKLKQFHENYGYDLESVLAKHPIKELENIVDKSSLVASLQKGNRQSVTFLHEGNEQKHFIEASPQFKSINIYDGNQKRLRQNQDEKESSSQSVKQETKKSNKVKDSGDDGPEPAAKQKKQRKPSL